MPELQPTYVERFVRNIEQLSLWRKALIICLAIGLPYGLAYLEGVHTTILNRDTWRTAYFPTVIIIYIAVVAPWIWRTEKEVAEGLRSLVSVPPNIHGVSAHKSWWRSSLGDWCAFIVGFLIGTLLLSSSPPPDLRYWSMRYWAATLLIMYGALAWLIYAAMGSARWTAFLHRYVLHKDPFNLKPFEPVGRQGLVLALIFVGAITLSLLFLYTRTMFFDWRSIVIYSILVIVTISIFFTVMWPAHRILQRVKEQKLAGVKHLIDQNFHKLEALAEERADTGPVAIEVQAWLTLEQRLKQTRTWPHDTEMLRTLFLSVLTPFFVALARAVGTFLTESYF